MLFLRLTERRVLKVQKRVWIAEPVEPRLSDVDDKTRNILNASIKVLPVCALNLR